MDPIFGSPLWNRTPLRTNNRTHMGAQFQSVPSKGYKGYKANEKPRKISWAGTGRGVQGESVNAVNNAYGQVSRRSWRPS